MAQSETRQSFMNRSCAHLCLKCAITLTGNQRHRKTLQFHETEGKTRCDFSKGYTKPVQNPAELGSMCIGELEFPG